MAVYNIQFTEELTAYNGLCACVQGEKTIMTLGSFIFFTITSSKEMLSSAEIIC